MIASTALGVPATFGTLAVVALIACIAPIVVSLQEAVRIPAVVIEVILGALVGPGGLDWVRPNEATEVLSFLGLGFLLFVAGLEVEPEATRNCVKPVSTAFALSVVLAVPFAYAVSLIEPITQPLLVAFALSSTSLGVVIAVLLLKRQPDEEFDQLTIANASFGEFGSLMLIAVFFSTKSGSAGLRVLTLVLFGATVVVGALIMSGVFRNVGQRIDVERFRRRTWQLDLRFSILILVGFAGLASTLGADAILGAFAAGVLIRLSDRDRVVRDESFMTRVDAVGFGLLIPVFFVSSGLDLDFRALFHSPFHIVLVPIFFVGFLFCRALPVFLVSGDMGKKRAAAVGLLSATTLTVVVVAVDTATSLKVLDTAAATALVTAALLTQVVCPPLALAMLGGETQVAPDAENVD